MNLAVGAHLGPYEIQSLIGTGGMGEVYKARDTRLDRSVAIKVLTVHVSADPQRATRFKREVTALTGIDHSDILIIEFGREPAGAGMQPWCFHMTAWPGERREQL